VLGEGQPLYGTTPGFLIPSDVQPGFNFDHVRGGLAPFKPLVVGVPKGLPYVIRTSGGLHMREDSPTGPMLLNGFQGNSESAVLTGPTTGTRYGKASGNDPIGNAEIAALTAAFGLSDEDPGFPAWLDLDSDGFITLADHARLLSLVNGPELIRKTLWIRGDAVPPSAGPSPNYTQDFGSASIEIMPVGATSYSPISPDAYLHQICTLAPLHVAYRHWRFIGDGVHVAITQWPYPSGVSEALKVRSDSPVSLSVRFQPDGGPVMPAVSVNLPVDPKSGRYGAGVTLDPIYLSSLVSAAAGTSPMGIAPGVVADGSTVTVFTGGPGSTTRIRLPLRGTLPPEQGSTIRIDPFPVQWYRAMYDGVDPNVATGGLWCGEILAPNPPNVVGPARLKFDELDWLPLAAQFGNSSAVPPSYVREQRWSHFLIQLYGMSNTAVPDPYNPDVYIPIYVDIVSLRANGTELGRLSNVRMDVAGFVDFSSEGQQSHAILSVIDNIFASLFFRMVKFNSSASRPIVLTDLAPPPATPTNPGGWPGVDALQVETGGSVIVIPGGAGW
jgi:hypothetical protein